MIVGLGSDLIDITRIERTLERFGERFTRRVFTEAERQRSDRRRLRAASYARRFAAKEACSKALGTGLRQGVFWRDMGVVNLPGGRPTLRIDRRRGAGALRACYRPGRARASTSPSPTSRRWPMRWSSSPRCRKMRRMAALDSRPSGGVLSGPGPRRRKSGFSLSRSLLP